MPDIPITETEFARFKQETERWRGSKLLMPIYEEDALAIVSLIETWAPIVELVAARNTQCQCDPPCLHQRSVGEWKRWKEDEKPNG